VIANGEGPALEGVDLARFSATLTTICRWSAIQMVKDGEGAEHAVRIDVRGAADTAEAERVARAIGASPLVKAAIFGRDPNWGRIEQAVGQALIGAPGEVHEPLLAFDGLAVDAAGIEQVLALPEYDLRVDLGRGRGEAEVFASDLTHAYVSINADYTT
jgi:glutamate N-acetyltransferase / amino-acid N-acetyltransferase